ncbi:unnamed protein product [Notodromas monacha]|uniref:Peptidase S1 domain-containing protein n=1 Tax=Notodromas monacha TaxID=399045 RepID=A0A7R9GGI5_9CRUS|nr:unnamed protein product [Notodromas monacha]CAG0920441.1 unnamed protein product [Notodromas monacha]
MILKFKTGFAWLNVSHRLNWRYSGKITNALSGFLIILAENFPEGTSQIGKVHTPRVVGGDTAEPGQFPYIVDITLHDIHGPFSSCAASIITEDFLLTAACIIMIILIFILAKKTGWIVHERSLLGNTTCGKMMEPNNSDQQSGLSPTRNFVPNTPYLIMGWGTLQYESDETPDVLQWGIVEYVDLKTCRENYVTVPFPVTDDMICAGRTDERIDTCEGDSGGPLVDSETGKLVGIVSWGHKCAEPEFPGVYTNVAYFIDWIHEKISAAASV